MQEPVFSITYIGTRMAHHGRHAGYDRLADYIPSTIQTPNMFYKLCRLLPERVLARIRRTAGTWYNSRALLQELQAGVSMLSHRRRLFHFLYGEDGFHYAGYWNRQHSHRIVATYHMPPKKFYAITPSPEHLRTLDALVIVAPNQEQVFKKILPPDRVHLIPHGVDTQFFCPPPITQQRKRQCLFVGSHLRDLATLRKAMQILTCKDPSISYRIVSDPKTHTELGNLPHTLYATAIPEHELRQLYQCSSVLLLPLLDATANNTLLEALACGLPVVATDTGGIRLYGEAGGVVFVPPGDEVQMADEALRILDDPQYRNQLARAGRANAEQFDWVRIAKQMRQLYLQLTT